MSAVTLSRIPLSDLPQDAFKALADFLRLHPKLSYMEEITYTEISEVEGVKEQQVCFHFRTNRFPESLALFFYEEKMVGEDEFFVWKAVYRSWDHELGSYDVTYLVEVNADSDYEFSLFNSPVEVSLAQVQAYNRAVGQIHRQLFGEMR